MAYKPTLTVDVEYEGATFTFKTPDTGLSKLHAATQECRAAGMSDADIDRNPSAEMLQALVAVFVEGVVAWDGVEGETAHLACNGGTKRAIPFADKLALANLYVQRVNELQVGKVTSAAPDTSTTEREDPADDSMRVTTSPVNATLPEAEPVEA